MNDQINYYNQKLEYEMDSSDLFDAINAGELLIVIDARKPFAYANEHIPLANNFPHREITEASTKHLDRKILYVTYCDGIGCNASTKGALKLAQLGFRVKELIGGLDWWKRDGYATHGTKAKEGLKLNCAC